MRIRTVKYHIEEGYRGILKNGLMSLASVATVAACAFILIISLCIVINLDYILEQLEKDIGLTVFIGEEVSDEQVKEIDAQIQALEHVEKTEFISKEGALEWAKENWSDNQNILAGFENDNPFPRSIEITLDNPKNQATVVKAIEDIQYKFESALIRQLSGYDEEKVDEMIEVADGEIEIDEEILNQQKQLANQQAAIGSENYKYKGLEKISSAPEITETLVAISTALRVISIILVGIMCAVSIAIIMNTIKLTVFIRKNEITIMKYVGATDWFIRWPFIVEGVLIGFVGSIIPLIISVISYAEMVTLIHEEVPLISNIVQMKTTLEMFSIIFPMTLLTGMALGVIGSMTSIRKYLNV